MGLGSIIKKVASVAVPVAASAASSSSGGSFGLGDALSIGGSLLGGMMTNEANAQSAAKANEFTKEMMKNRHQWEVNDLKAAGLNPILSAHGTPSMGSAQKADVVNPTDNAIRGYEASTARGLAKANIQNIEAMKMANVTQADLNRAAEKAKQAEAMSSAAAADKLQTDAALNRIAMVPAAAQARNSAKEADTWTNKYVRPHTKPIADFIGDFTGAIGNVFHGSANTSTGTYTNKR